MAVLGTIMQLSKRHLVVECFMQSKKFLKIAIINRIAIMNDTFRKCYETAWLSAIKVVLGRL